MEVALKALRPELAASLFANRFIREIRLAAGLRHAGIVPALDWGEADEIPFFTMPFVVGETLRARLEREGQLEYTDVARITGEIASALSHAHEHNVVHRDIKPENVMITGGRTVVLDFGIARALVAASGDWQTPSSIVVGTPYYMSPEQRRGERDLDARCDVYSLACIAYEMLCGRPPFATVGGAGLAVADDEPPPSVTGRCSSLGTDTDQVLAKALAPGRADRFTGAIEFARALCGCLHQGTEGK